MIVDPDLPTHRKTLKAATLLRVNRDAVVVLLLFMWGHCQQRRDDLLGQDDADLAACCQWEGPPKKLRAALVSCALIDKTERGWIAHGWRERNHAWLSRIEGGRKRSAHVARDEAGRLLPASAQLAGQLAASNAGGVEWSGVENLHGPSRAPAREAITPETLLSAKKRICRLLGCPEQWEPDAEQALQAILPTMAEDDWRAVEWLYLQPREDGKNKRPLLKTSPRAFCRDWAGVVSSARRYAADIGAQIGLAAKKEPAPAGWREWLAEKHPRAVENFRTFEEMPPEIREQCRAALQAA